MASKNIQSTDNSDNLSIDKKDQKKTINKDRMKHKKRGNSGVSDDTSVDSRGNIRGLIEYDEDTIQKTTRKPRKAAINARKKIKNEVVKGERIDPPKNTCHGGKEREGIRALKSIMSKVYEKSDNKDDEFFNGYKKYLKEENHHKKTKHTIDDSESSSEDDSHKNEVSNVADDESSDNSYKLSDGDSDEEDNIEESDDGDNDEDESSDEESDSTDEESENDTNSKDNSARRSANLIIALGGDDETEWGIPKHHNLKKESKAVNKFVKLVTTPMEDNTIDNMIDQFKALNQQKQDELIKNLENRPTTTDSGVNLMMRILNLKVVPELQAHILAKYNALQTLDPSSGEYYKLRNWLDKAVSVPFGKYIDFPIRLDDGQDKCTLFMKDVKKSLDGAIFGQEEPKLQVMQFISTKIVNPSNNGLCMLLIGPPGIGKTSLIKNGIAKALKWPFQFISLGGDSDASSFAGHQLVYESSHCGKIVNSLVEAKAMNCVMLFDEVDKISQSPKGEEIQSLLIHLTDPQANNTFEDKYLTGMPIDLSKVMFVFSANDISKIDRVLLDRLVVIHMDGYDFKQKVEIAKKYLIPTALAEVNLTEKLDISSEIISYIIENYSSDEKGVRQLKRNFDQIAQKVNMLRMFNMPELPFYIKDFHLPFVIKKEHVDLFITKKNMNMDAPPYGMYN